MEVNLGGKTWLIAKNTARRSRNPIVILVVPVPTSRTKVLITETRKGGDPEGNWFEENQPVSRFCSSAFPR
jgi:hypothetical protein